MMSREMEVTDASPQDDTGNTEGIKYVNPVQYAQLLRSKVQNAMLRSKDD